MIITNPTTGPKPRRAARPGVALFAAFFSWFLFTLSFVLLAFSTIAVVSVGGRCASGSSAYEIAVQCPHDSIVFLPWCIFTGIIAVGLGRWLTRGFGMQLYIFAWPILFCGLGWVFIQAFVSGFGVVGLILGILFVIMGLVPLVIEGRASVQRIFLGSFTVRGQQYYEGPKAQASFNSRTLPNPPGAVPPNFGDVLLSFATVIVGGFAGVALAFWLVSVV